MLIDIGTTTSHLARALHGREVTVITSSLAVYEELAHDESVELILLGGVVRRNYRSLVGFLTEARLRQVRADMPSSAPAAYAGTAACWTPPRSRCR